MAKRGRSFWSALGFGAAVGALFVLERMRPLRSPKEPGPSRAGGNLTIGLLAAARTAASEIPLVSPLQRLTERRQMGLLRRLQMPHAVRLVFGFLLLDYTLYIWPRAAARRSRGAASPPRGALPGLERSVNVEYHVEEVPPVVPHQIEPAVQVLREPVLSIKSEGWRGSTGLIYSYATYGHDAPQTGAQARQH